MVRKSLNFIADTLELIVNDLTGSKRSRRRATKKSTRSYAHRQKPPVLIIRVVQEQ